MVSPRSLHVFRVLSLLSIAVLLIGWRQYYALEGRTPQTSFEYLMFLGFVFALPNFIPSALGTIGLMLYPPPVDLEKVQPIACKVIFRIVSKGENTQILSETIQRCRNEIRRTPLFLYHIEVVVEDRSPFESANGTDITTIRVPTGYVTQNRTRFKARALHYAMLNSTAELSDWIIFLDEETQPTTSGIRGVCRMIAEEEKSGKLRVGQGAILYHRKMGNHPFLTLADMIRTGDDFGRFYLQHRIGSPIFGLHGSYIVARNDVIKKTGGFDFGPQGHITEDAYWAMLLIRDSVHSRWVDGFMEEQSTQSFSDFTKQRARWFVGIWKVALHAPTKLVNRLCLLGLAITWSLTPLAVAFAIIDSFLGFSAPIYFRLPVNFALIYVIIVYLIGLEVNLRARNHNGFWSGMTIRIATVLFIPIFGLMETCGVLRGMFSADMGFYVVKK